LLLEGVDVRDRRLRQQVRFDEPGELAHRWDLFLDAFVTYEKSALESVTERGEDFLIVEIVSSHRIFSRPPLDSFQESV